MESALTLGSVRIELNSWTARMCWCGKEPTLLMSEEGWIKTVHLAGCYVYSGLLIRNLLSVSSGNTNRSRKGLSEHTLPHPRTFELSPGDTR